jgi:DNA polymerase-3 subunit alpha
MPDIDLDFQDDRRDEVISYATSKYGQDRVAQIITFGTLGARAALRDVGRALGMPYGDVDRVARLVPMGPNMTLERALEESGDLRDIYQQDEAVRYLFASARRLEGTARHASTHAAGVVISREPLIQHVPLQQAGKGGAQGIVMTQFSMENIARVGLLKMDLLGLANLTILSRAKKIISQDRGIEIDLHHIPLDDAGTFGLLASGETSGVFQLEGTGMRRYIKELKPSSFSDIAAMIALYRPGPMEHIPTFISAKHGLEPIQYPHPALSQILEETYVVIVYQDQVLLIVQAFAGYTLGEADTVRKAMGKKIPKVMRKERQKFIAGAKGKGFSQEIAEQVFALIEPFAGYAFNKAHSVSYAMIAYQTAYLKANYPIEYMTAFLTTNSGQPEKVASAVAECRRMDIPVLGPDINHSQATFSAEQNQDGAPAIRFGLADIKNIGTGAIEPILAARKEGEFKSVGDFCRRADLRGMNKRVLESLIKAGALDSVGSRGTLLGNIERIISMSQREQQLKETGQAMMFDLWGGEASLPLPTLDSEESDVSSREKLAWEKELLGVYLSEHPFSRAASKLESSVTALCGQIDAEMEGQRVTAAGIVAWMRQILTRSGQPFVTARLEDLDGDIEVTAWTEVYSRTRELWKEGNLLIVSGKVKVRGERVQLICDEVHSYRDDDTARRHPDAAHEEPAPPSKKQMLTISISQTADEARDIELFHRILNALREYPGQDEIRFAITGNESTAKLKMPNMAVGWCPELHQQLARLVGEESFALEEIEK